MCPTDPSRAAGLLGDAERAARVITDEGLRALRQRLVAAELAAINPHGAVRLAEGITRGGDQAQALAAIAQSLATTDPDWAALLLAEAERVVSAISKAPHWQYPIRAEAVARQVISDDYAMSVARGAIVKVLAPADADRALRLADSISDTRERDRAVARVAAGLAATDPDRAEQLARGRIGKLSLTSAMTAIALATTDPDRAGQLLAGAERTARAIPNPAVKASALLRMAIDVAAVNPGMAGRLLADAERAASAIAEDETKWSKLFWVAKGLALIDPDRALRVARTIADLGWAANARAEIAVRLAVTDSDRAEGLLTEAERIAGSISDWSLGPMAQTWVAGAKAEAVKAMAASAPFRAERIARSITREALVPKALAAVGVALSSRAPDRAERLLAEAESLGRSITDPQARATALTDIARLLMQRG